MRLKKGFTIAELLVVVAIIAILVAIGIPIFTSWLEKSKEATDAANIRTKYGEMMSEVVSGNYNYGTDSNKYIVKLVQNKDAWQTNIELSFDMINGIPKKSGIATLYYKNDLSILDFGNSTTVEEIKKKATEYSTNNQYNKSGTLYIYDGTYFIATQNKEGDNTPKDNEKGLFKVNFDNIISLDTQSDEEYLKISVENHRGDVIYVKDENKFYVIYDTNKTIDKDSKKQEITFN